jgi:hypothetical protein
MIDLKLPFYYYILLICNLTQIKKHLERVSAFKIWFL